MENKRGSLSITSENIFPVIKKWLYSDHDIFYRELISNGCDAITKLKKLDMMGEYELPEDYKAKIQVIVSPEDKTLTFIDNGLGMTAEEVEEYIRSLFPVLPTSWRSTRTRQVRSRSSVISDWDFIQPSWLRMRYISIPYLIRKVPRLYIGNVTAVLSSRWVTETRQKSEPRSLCS